MCASTLSTAFMSINSAGLAGISYFEAILDT